MLETSYFQWLCDLIRVDRPDKSYYLLCGELHKYPFKWIIERDENRAIDGAILRSRYGDCAGDCLLEPDDYSCSIFEMIIALSERMKDELMQEDDDDDCSKYFWEIIHNLGLDVLDDEHYDEKYGNMDVKLAVDMINNRTFKRNGYGGMFPLNGKCKNQKKVEIWYQMMTYIDENYKIIEV